MAIVDGVERKPHLKWRLPHGYFSEASKMLRDQWFIAFGNAFEWYEFYLYGFLAKPINENFFKGNGNLTWLAFGFAMAMRPFGSFFFGWLGDNYGRRLAFLTAVFGMSLCTTLHGCLPSYYTSSDAVGTVGLVILIILRATQGFCCGGQVASSSVSLAEIKQKHLMGAGAGAVMVGTAVAMILANGFASLLSNLLSQDQLNLWGWRIPFLSAAIPGMVAIVYRTSVKESHGFKSYKQKERSSMVDESPQLSASVPEKKDANDAVVKEQAEPPGTAAIDTPETTSEPDLQVKPRPPHKLLKHVIINYPWNCIGGFFGVFSCAVWTYIGAGSWQVSYVSEYGEISTAAALNASLVSNFCFLFANILVMMMIDIYGVGLLNVIGMCGSAVIATLIWTLMILQLDNVAASFAFTALLGMCRAFIGGCTAMLWTAELYPTNVRMTGFIFYNIAFSLIGGFGPFIANLLAEWSVWGPLGLLVITTGINVVTVIGLYIAHCRGTMTTAHIRPELY